MLITVQFHPRVKQSRKSPLILAILIKIRLTYLNINIMYNAFLDNRNKNELKREKLIQKSKHKIAQRYYSKIQPDLLNNYNKRINDFILRLEHQPYVIKQNPNQLDLPAEKKKRKSFTIMRRHSHSQKNYYPSTEPAQQTQFMTQQLPFQQQFQTFKYKNSEDWTGLMSFEEKEERKKRLDYYMQRFGDPNIAFRSIASQSSYRPGYNFRTRNKSLEIHPPMNYSKLKYKQNVKQVANEKGQKQNKLKKQQGRAGAKNNASNDNRSLLNGSSFLLGDESIANSHHAESIEGESSKQDQRQIEQKIGKKIYFKQVADIEQNLKEAHAKKVLKELLQKCGVYKKKVKKQLNDKQIDEFSKFEKF